MRAQWSADSNPNWSGLHLPRILVSCHLIVVHGQAACAQAPAAAGAIRLARVHIAEAVQGVLPLAYPRRTDVGDAALLSPLSREGVEAQLALGLASY